METVCRVCMLSSAATLNIFDGTEKSDVSIADIVSSFMGFKVRQGDSFPENICQLCLQDARNAFNRRQALEEHHRLQTQVKEEKEIHRMKQEVAGEDLLEEEVCRVSDCERETSPSAEQGYLHEIPVKYEESDEDASLASHPMQFDIKVKNERIEEDQLEDEGPTEESTSDEDSNAFECVVKVEENDEEHDEDNTNSNQSFKCPHCPSSYTRKTSLNSHIRKHTGERPYTCSHCQSSFTVKRQLEDHVRIHTGERPFACGQCEKSFRKRTDLKLHKRIHLEVRPFQCSQCSKSFVRRYRLVEHTLSHSGERPFQCPHCQKSFTTKVRLQVHIDTHLEEKVHQCSECPKAFKNRRNLVDHIRNHAKEQHLRCTECPKTFVHPSSLRTHLLLHTTERPHKCLVCGAAFTLPAGLRKHMKTDCYKKLIQCPQCPASFRFPEILREHIIALHPDTSLESIPAPPERPHKCTVCSAAFAKKRYLRSHMQRNCYKNLNNCLQCSVSCKSPELLREHIISAHPLTPIINEK